MSVYEHLSVLFYFSTFEDGLHSLDDVVLVGIELTLGCCQSLAELYETDGVDCAQAVGEG